MTPLSVLQKRTIKTHLGPITFWSQPETAGELRPVLLVACGYFAPLDSFGEWPDSMAGVAQVALVDLPLREANGFIRPSLERMADALGLAIHEAFHRRPVAILGLGDASLVALMARAPEIVRVFAVEPPLQPAKAKARLACVQQIFQSEASETARAYLTEVFGVSEAAPAARDHRIIVRRSPTPVDVIAAGLPSGSDTVGSELDAEDRAWLAGEAQVSMRLLSGRANATDAGVRDQLLDQVRIGLSSLEDPPRPAPDLARQLARAAPRDVGRVLFMGPAYGDFETTYRAINPAATCTATALDGATFDLMVLLDLPAAGTNWVKLVALLEDGGRVLATTPLGPASDRVEALLAACGMSLVADDPIIAPTSSALIRARKAPARPVTRVEIVPYARVLMDVRTRLPADNLRSDFDLQIDYCLPPFSQVAGPSDPPKVVVMQRPPNGTPAAWQDLVARAILARHVVVIEFDDHPELVSQMVKNKGLEPGDWERFRAVHAVQTSTDQLIDVFSHYNPEVKVFPNAAFDLTRFEPGSRPRRVFYGGVTRGPFAVEVAKSLAPAIAAYPETEFLVVGDRAFFEALPTQRKSFSGYVPYERYLQIMASCRVSLSPLQYRPMMETKSDAKYLDASRAGLVTIASPTVYERTIRSGENGLIAQALEDWPAMLAMVLGDADLSERLARTAWEDMRANRMFADQIADRRAWYAGLLDRRATLDQAVLDRNPGVAARLATLRA